MVNYPPLLKNLRSFNIGKSPTAPLAETTDFGDQGFRTYRFPRSTTIITTIALVVNDAKPFEELPQRGITIGAFFGALLGDVSIEELPVLLAHENECIRLGAKEILEEL